MNEFTGLCVSRVGPVGWGRRLLQALVSRVDL